MKNVNEVICPVHGSNSGISLLRKFQYHEHTWELHKCEECEVLFYFPFPNIDYISHTDRLMDVIDYVHLNANIEGMIRTLLEGLPDGNRGPILEIGSGFGFLIDFASRVKGMNVHGFEPSLYGEIGSSELGVEITREYFDESNVPSKKYEIVFSSEVIEHRADPVSFLTLMSSALSDNGVLILTTPDIDLLSEDVFAPETLAMLSPGAHTILYSKPGLQKILQVVGFRFFKVYNLNKSLVIAASRRHQNWTTCENSESLARDYYFQVLPNLATESCSYAGIYYRLFRLLVDNGDYASAEKLTKEFPCPPLPSFIQIRNLYNKEDWSKVSVSCAGPLLYYQGVYALNHMSDFQMAADLFERAFYVMERKIRIWPESCVVEFQMYWLARFHQALAWKYCDNDSLAKSILLEMKNFDAGEIQGYPAVGDELMNRALLLLAEIED